jgi:hypothetical protein
MGFYNAGNVFNYRFMKASTKLQAPTFRRQPARPIFGCGGNSVTNVTVQNGPSGFWGFMSGLFSGLTGGGMMMGMGNMFGGFGGFNSIGSFGNYSSPFGAVNGANAGSAQQLTPEQEQAQQLSNLKTLFPDVSFVAEKDGKFSATKKDGTLISDKTYDEMKKGLASVTPTGGKSDEVENPAVDNPDEEGKSGHADGQDDTGNVDNPGGTERGFQGVTPKGIPGWYKASNDKASYVKETKNADGTNKNATQVTNDILSSKLYGALTPDQQNELRNEIIKKNPSVFDKDGNPKSNADYSKLDVPTMSWIKTNILKETEDTKTDNEGANSATGKAKNSKTEVGNNQHITNQLYQKGYRETYCKGIYYKDGKHYKLNGNKLVTIKYNNIKQVNQDGSWYDTSGKLHKESLLD